MLEKYEVWRGISDLVAAEVLVDTAAAFTTGAVFPIAGSASISKTVNSSNSPVYYDNGPRLMISSEGPETITIEASAVPLDVLAKITGQYYDDARGALYGGGREVRYFAIGYKAKKQSSEAAGNGDVYVWRLKGAFTIPDETHKTINDSTDSNGTTLTYSGIYTTHKFANKPDANGEPQPATSCIVDTTMGLADVEGFFDAVTTPDTLVAKTAYKLTISQAAGTTVTVKRGGVTLANNADIYAGDHLTITVTGGTVTVNSVAFTSGDIHVVAGATTVASTAA